LIVRLPLTVKLPPMLALPEPDTVRAPTVIAFPVVDPRVVTLSSVEVSEYDCRYLESKFVEVVVKTWPYVSNVSPCSTVPPVLLVLVTELVSKCEMVTF